ncbi:MAG: fibronectin type III domain-containing protein [Myxococcota bacterium]|nr:fibronectin type III domain-containing protein [Myxococcota bacterium]
MTRRSRPAALVAGLAIVTAATSPVGAEDGVCQVIDLDFLPAALSTAAPMRPASQMVAWLEEPGGTFVDTIFITETTGTYGRGNRPGRADFNSGPNWPYGRRPGVFPVWARRHGLSFAEVVFQNGNEDNLSHPLKESSLESRFCRPLVSSEPQWDAGSCASKAYTDKGVLGSRTSNYPPRNDVTRAGPDHPSVAMFAMLNPFDAVSQATPPSGAPAQVSWMAPRTLPAGDYVLWLEVSREFDHNATYSVAARPEPDGIPWSDYGEHYRGQPSILYKVPVTITSSGVHVASTLDYVGYGDPDGRDGNVRPPDSTITTGVAGSGAERLAIRADGGAPYRLRVTSRVEVDGIKPGAPTDVAINTLTSTSAIVELVAPGDDGLTGQVRGYEIRYVAGGELTEAGFAAATELRPVLEIGAPGSVLEFPITGLLFDTEYTVGIRAIDDCRNRGPIALVTFRTPDRNVGEVDACFIATAAYGSVMANDVELLRRFRDVLLHETVLGELVVEAYYTFSPAVAGVVGESELLRATARSILDPLVGWVRAFRL